MYILLDTNITVGYYLKRSLNSLKAYNRITNLFDSVRTGSTDHFLYIPNICIAEVFNVFMKYTFGSWNRHVKKQGKTLDKRVYEGLVNQFETDIHNGKFLYQYELSRYHILAINLVAPIDHYFQVTRKHNNLPMGTFDHLIIAMSIHLAHIHKNENVLLLTADDRISNIVKKCRSNIPPNTIKKLKLDIAEKVTGKPFSKDIFPMCINLKTATDNQLKLIFGSWPLPIERKINVYRNIE